MQPGRSSGPPAWRAPCVQTRVASWHLVDGLASPEHGRPRGCGGPRMGKLWGRVPPAGSPTWLLSLRGRLLTLLCGHVDVRPPSPQGASALGKGLRTSRKSSHVVPAYGF